MQVRAIISDRYEQMELHVCNNEMNDQVSQLVDNLRTYVNDAIPSKAPNGDRTMVEVMDIIRIYTANKRVFLHTAQADYETDMKLFELEERLDSARFFRASRGEMVNLKKIKRLDLGLTGTIRVIMTDGSECFTSRRNVTALKKTLGI